MKSESVRELLARERAGGEATVQGWVRTARHGKEVSFLEVSDGSCFAGIQVVAAPELAEYESVVKALKTGAAVKAEGELVDSPGSGQRFELRARRVELVGDVGDDYPLLFDSGIRGGADVYKALARGADAVLVGRLQAYALAVAGALGVAHMVRLLREELEVCMAMTGCVSLADIRRSGRPDGGTTC